jgi:hypothetical protein
MGQASNWKQVKSALGEPKDPGSFFQVRTINLELYEIPDVTGPVRKVTVEGACPACSQPLCDNGRRLGVHPPRSIVSLCAALPAIC